MGLHDATERIGEAVQYTAFTGARPELVVITDVLDGAVLVRFLGCAYSRRVHPRDLAPLTCAGGSAPA